MCLTMQAEILVKNYIYQIKKDTFQLILEILH